MANPYYTPSGNPGFGAPGQSAPIRSEYTAIQAAFDKLPLLAGHANEFVVVNGAGTALTTIAGLSFTMNAFTVVLVANGNATLQLPGVNGTLALTSQTNVLFASIGTPQVFTGSGTYTPNAKMLYCIIECWGGGGGGGGVASTGGGIRASGGGGGAGSYSRKRATAAEIGASKAVTIGAAGTAGAAGNNAGGNGGDTSVSTLCVGKGASGGPGNGGGLCLGGAGGVAGTGDVTGVGEDGFNGASTTGGSALLGFGGSAQPVGCGGGRRYGLSLQQDGAAATGRASGGSGGMCDNGGSPQAGGVGTAGLVVVTEFLSP